MFSVFSAPQAIKRLARVLMARWGVLFLIIFSSAVQPLLQVATSEQSWKQLVQPGRAEVCRWGLQAEPGAPAAAKEPIQHGRGERKLFGNTVTG